MRHGGAPRDRLAERRTARAARRARAATARMNRTRATLVRFSAAMKPADAVAMHSATATPASPTRPERLHAPGRARRPRRRPAARRPRTPRAPSYLRRRVERELALEDAGGRPRDGGERHVDRRAEARAAERSPSPTVGGAARPASARWRVPAGVVPAPAPARPVADRRRRGRRRSHPRLEDAARMRSCADERRRRRARLATVRPASKRQRSRRGVQRRLRSRPCRRR